ncbi:rhomboid family intramembrane serine protease [Lignipirellula cremea]|uniref:Rhomboid family protein n=1 Tax=Lignipirellula cremea TaxID=2528010 RepID=A0A518DSM3_9BACT|nr:rhomboid family intramembrane serine protease [Lignipirellula cremea]QDU94824.1 Rhomboid family protein [Lignipirellula cremea]
MGYQDRDYFRDENRGGFQFRSPRTAVMWLILINVALFVVGMFMTGNSRSADDGIARRQASNPITRTLSLKADVVQQPWNCWQLLTYGFVHADVNTSTGIFHILFNMIGLFIFGRFMEPRLGRYEFTLFYLTSIVFAGLVWLGWVVATEGVGSQAMIGASGGVTAIVLLFCMSNPNQDLMVFPSIVVKAWIVGVIFVGMDLLKAFGNSDIAWQAHLGGAAFAGIYFMSGFRFERIIKKEWWKRKPNLRVHHPDAEFDDERYRALDEEADRLLEKISREGESSLSTKERRALEDYSRRMRQKHR